MPLDSKANLVKEVFDTVAPAYDVMNDVMSMGLHRLWKDQLVARLAPFAGMKHLDVAGGTVRMSWGGVNVYKQTAARW